MHFNVGLYSQHHFIYINAQQVQNLRSKTAFETAETVEIKGGRSPDTLEITWIVLIHCED